MNFLINQTRKTITNEMSKQDFVQLAYKIYGIRDSFFVKKNAVIN